jgi:hypothetical protein
MLELCDSRTVASLKNRQLCQVLAHGLSDVDAQSRVLNALQHTPDSTLNALPAPSFKEAAEETASRILGAAPDVLVRVILASARCKAQRTKVPPARVTCERVAGVVV